MTTEPRSPVAPSLLPAEPSPPAVEPLFAIFRQPGGRKFIPVFIFLLVAPALLFVPFPPWIEYLRYALMTAGALTWCAAIGHVVNHLFDRLEARWPATRPIREILWPLLKTLLRFHRQG